MFIFLNNFRKLLFFVVNILFLAGAILSAQTPAGAVKKPDSCSFLAKTEVQSILGKPVKEDSVGPSANGAAGATCEYLVGDDGLFSILVKAAGPAETADAFLAGLASSKIKTEAAPGFGDRSFYAFPGCGMLQLHAFKSGQFVILTMMIPSQAEEKLKAPLGKLMQMVLAKI